MGSRPWPLVLAMILLLGTAALVNGHGVASPEGGAKRHAIAIRGFRFEPAVVQVSPGDTVVWTNRDLVPHTVTTAVGIDSGTLDPGTSWTLVLQEADPTDYLCAFHPNMTGRLVIDGAPLRKEIP